MQNPVQKFRQISIAFKKPQLVTKIYETHYIFIKKVHKKTLGLVKVTQNPPFPLTQCCAKPEEAMPGSQDQK